MRKISEETKRKIGISNKGKHHSEATKIKISVSKLNNKYHPTEEHKKIISEYHKGKKHSLGYKHTLEAREKISKNNVKYWKGKNHSKITRAKIRDARAKQVFPMHDTKIEVKIQNFLKQLNIDFLTHQYIKDIEHGYQCDILIPSMNLVIECDGDYWHKYPIGNDIDHIRTSELLEKGFNVLRLWENEINKMGVEEFKGVFTNALLR